MIEVTSETKACFIDRNAEVNPRSRVVIEAWLKIMNPAISYSTYIVEIVSANDLEKRAWDAVMKSDHVWAQSYLDGEAAKLFSRLLRLAKQAGVKDKIFLDLAERINAMHNFLLLDPEGRSLMKSLEQENNIRFFFWEDIWEMMK